MSQISEITMYIGSYTNGACVSVSGIAFTRNIVNPSSTEMLFDYIGHSFANVFEVMLENFVNNYRDSQHLRLWCDSIDYRYMEDTELLYKYSTLNILAVRANDIRRASNIAVLHDRAERNLSNANTIIFYED